MAGDARIEANWKDSKPVGPVKITFTMSEEFKIVVQTEDGMTGSAVLTASYPDNSTAIIHTTDTDEFDGPGTVTLSDGSQHTGYFQKLILHSARNGDVLCKYNRDAQKMECPPVTVTPPTPE